MTLMRTLLLGLVVAVIGAMAWQLLATDPGVVILRRGGVDAQVALAWAVLAALVLALALWLLWTLVTLPFRAWTGRRDRISRSRMGNAMEAMHHGHHARAEKLYEEAANDGASGIARVAAARAALARDARDDARRHLDAIDGQEAATRAIAEAELALDDDRPTDALVALDAPAAQPLPPRGLLLRAQAAAASGQSAQAYGLLGALRQQKALPEAALSRQETLWAAASLREAPDANELAARWESLSKPLRAEPEVAIAYADRAAALGWDEAALKSLGQSLDSRWDERLASRYAALPVGRLDERRTRFEGWLRAHPSSPAMLLGLGRNALDRGDHAAAERHAEAAIAQGAGAPAWELLGDLYAGTGHGAQGAIAYRNALRTARGEPVEPLAQAPDASPAVAPALATPQAPPAIAADPTTPEVRDSHGHPRLAEDPTRGPTP